MFKNRLSALSILSITIILLWNSINEVAWKKTGVMTWDVACYYGYLTKAFNHKTDEPTVDELKMPAMFPPNKYVEAPNGNKVLKTSMGMALAYLPFYSLGYLLHYINSGSSGSGMEVEYRMMMQFNGTFYLLAALLLLRYFLRKHFEDSIVALTLLLVALGTNAYYYTVYEGCMTHVVNMFLFLLFLFATEKWYANVSIVNTILLGLLAGWLSLIRPTNALLSILFVFYNVSSFNTVSARIKFLWDKRNYLLLIPAFAFLVWIPQLIYWHELTGQYFFYSYLGERFYFDRPRIFNGMLGGRKGWLLYTPVGWLMLAGFIWMYKKLKNLFWSTLVFYVVFVYVIFSWWCWWYGGSFGSRAMVDVYGILAFPLACLLSAVFLNAKVATKVLFSIFLLALTSLNLFQTWQYKLGIMHYDSMSHLAYKKVFLQTEYLPDSVFTPPIGYKAVEGLYTE